MVRRRNRQKTAVLAAAALVKAEATIRNQLDAIQLPPAAGSFASINADSFQHFSEIYIFLVV